MAELDHPLNPGVGAVWLNGAVVGKDGKLSLSGFIPKGKEFEGGKLAMGTGVLRNPLGAEYHVTIRDHGEFDSGVRNAEGLGQTESADACNGPCGDDQSSGARAGFVMGAFRNDELPPPP